MPVAIGVALGAAAFFFADRAVEGIGGREGSGSLPLTLGSLLDGVAEQAGLGIGLAAGQGVSVALLVAVFVSNLPEAVGSASEMRAAGRSTGVILRLWPAVTLVCAPATMGVSRWPTWSAAATRWASTASLPGRCW